MRFIIAFLLLSTSAPLAAQQKGFITAGKLQVYYEKNGKGPELVLLHAGYMDHTMWGAQVKALSRTHTVITIDLPRHGLTKGSDSTILIADLLRICLDSLYIEKASFAGLSLGGVAIADFALAYPDRVSKLIFVCSGLAGFREVIPIDSVTNAVFNRSEKANATDDIFVVARTFALDWAAGPFRDSLHMAPAVFRYVYSHVVATLEQHLNDHPVKLKDTPPQAFEVNRILAPALIIWAELDVPIIKSEAEYLHEKIKGSELHEMHGIAHMVNIEKPDEFNRLLLQFLIK